MSPFKLKSENLPRDAHHPGSIQNRKKITNNDTYCSTLCDPSDVHLREGWLMKFTSGCGFATRP